MLNQNKDQRISSHDLRPYLSLAPKLLPISSARGCLNSSTLVGSPTMELASKYLSILNWILKSHPEGPTHILNYRRNAPKTFRWYFASYTKRMITCANR